jgi:hypothetical protein
MDTGYAAQKGTPPIRRRRSRLDTHARPCSRKGIVLEVRGALARGDDDGGGEEIRAEQGTQGETQRDGTRSAARGTGLGHCW